jgi:hypothetical protein
VGWLQVYGGQVWCFPNYSIVRAAYNKYIEKIVCNHEGQPLTTSKPSHFLSHLGGSNIYMGCWIYNLHLCIPFACEMFTFY